MKTERDGLFSEEDDRGTKEPEGWFVGGWARVGGSEVSNAGNSRKNEAAR